MWKKAGIKVKTAHCLRVTCAMKLFTSGTEEKNDLRKGHRSNALFSYQISKVLKLPGPCSSAITAATTGKDGESNQPAIILR